MKRYRPTPLDDFERGDIVIDTITKQVGKVLTRGRQQSEVRWREGYTQVVCNHWIKRHEELGQHS
jgi:hypothetical protein